MKSYNIFKKTFALCLFLSLLGCGKDSTPKLIKNQKLKSRVGIVANPKLDILFVIDNSGSMGSHQDHLANQIDLFLQGLGALSHIDYQIGVITTDIDQNLLAQQGFYTKIQPVDVLKNNLQVGTGGSGHEIHFETAKKALEDSIASQGMFYRSNAHLAIIFLTDTEDKGSVTGSEFYDYLVQLKGGKSRRIHAYGALDLSEPNCDGEGEGSQKLRDFINRVNENRVLLDPPYFSLCDSQFSMRLLNIGKSISQYVGKIVYLKHIPDLSTMLVKYGDEIIPQDALKGWVYNPRFVRLELGNDVKFKNPDPNVKLEVFYHPIGRKAKL